MTLEEIFRSAFDTARMDMLYDTPRANVSNTYEICSEDLRMIMCIVMDIVNTDVENLEIVSKLNERNQLLHEVAPHFFSEIEDLDTPSHPVYYYHGYDILSARVDMRLKRMTDPGTLLILRFERYPQFDNSFAFYLHSERDRGEYKPVEGTSDYFLYGNPPPDLLINAFRNPNYRCMP